LVPVACYGDNEPVKQPESMVPPIEHVSESTRIVPDLCFCQAPRHPIHQLLNTTGKVPQKHIFLHSL
jgi:hypothetical protein